jgi:hypothetical protein
MSVVQDILQVDNIDISVLNSSAVLLLAKCNVYSTGTVWSNRKGWNKQLMNCEKKNDRGRYKLSCDIINRVQAMQWVDSSIVVNMVTILLTVTHKLARCSITLLLQEAYTVEFHVSNGWV